MKKTLETTFNFSDYPLKSSEKTNSHRTKLKQFLSVASVTINAKLSFIRRDYRVHPEVSNAANWDENWFCNYE